MKLIVCLVLSILCAAASAVAQDVHKNELGLLLGGEFIPSRSTASGANIDFSGSIVFSADYARRLAGDNTAVYLEFPFAAAPSHKIASPPAGAITDLAVLYIVPSVRVQFGDRSSISPWLSGGFGYGEYEGSKLLSDGTTNSDVRQHVGTAQFGAGLDVRTPIRVLFPVGLRGEVRDYYTVSSPSFGVPVTGQRQHNVVVSGGIVLRF